MIRIGNNQPYQPRRSNERLNGAEEGAQSWGMNAAQGQPRQPRGMDRFESSRSRPGRSQGMTEESLSQGVYSEMGQRLAPFQEGVYTPSEQQGGCGMEYRPMPPQGLEGQIQRPQPPSSEAMFDVLDADGDGAVTGEEFLEALPDDGSLSSEQASELFSRLDADGDGAMTLDEMEAALPRPQERPQMSGRMPHPDAFDPEAMVARLDQDGDGLLSAEELKAGMPQRRQPMLQDDFQG